ncbi:MAG: hypothetical protein ON057_000857 [Glomeribacter sp. 1016415]|nr:hypothetical protein [Glomeribacter sp. 1016415]
MDSANQSLIDFPCAFPIKVLGKTQPGFAEAIQRLLKEFDANFDGASIEMRPSRNGNYIGLTCTVHARNRPHLDEIYRALSSHPMVSVVL